ncbi:MAG TPA: hypothetical protein DCZ03_10495 [Gammaproteobacteria bacterium]|nr:hypothetical protein [Gammaproteobacteria bacterium]
MVNQQEQSRLRALSSLYILDTLPEESFDNVARLASQICNTPIALVSLVDRHRQWFKAAVGLDARETSREVSFCSVAIEKGETLVVEDATKDPRFVNNELVLSDPNIRFYAGVPLNTPEGFGLGTLCVIDNRPRKLEENQLQTLEVLATVTESYLLLRRYKIHNELMSRFVIHDIRNPLGVIRGTAELMLESRELNAVNTAKLQRVINESDRAVSIASDLMDYLMGSQGNLKLRYTQINTSEFLQELYAANSIKAQLTKHKIILDKETAPEYLATDAPLLRRIIDNLLDNALKYSPAESEITLRVQSREKNIVFTIEDNGPGIPKEYHQSIFEPHFRLIPDHVRPGNGIGLAFCRLIAEAMNGQIHVLSAEGEGTKFEVLLPLAHNVQ